MGHARTRWHDGRVHGGAAAQPREGGCRQGSVFESSTDDASVTVKTWSTMTESFPAKVQKGKRASGTVTVVLKGVASSATGVVKLLKGSKTIGQGKLSGGKVTIKLAKLAAGKNKLSAVWKGNAVDAERPPARSTRHRHRALAARGSRRSRHARSPRGSASTRCRTGSR
jgi:hypothetical protein